ncbi:MAG: 3-coathanger stack domain-containing protein [Leadbetterella sp.]
MLLRFLFFLLLGSSLFAQTFVITSPTANLNVSANSVLNLSISAPSNASTVNYYYDNYQLIEQNLTAPFIKRWVVNLAPGLHTIRARVFFTDGSSTQNTFVSITVLPEPPSTNIMKLGTNFWFLAPWSGETPFKSNVSWSTAYSSQADIWNPTFIDELEPYDHLRFMDWGLTNNSNLVQWADRRLPSDTNNRQLSQSGHANGAINPGLAYEWMIDLCNRTQKDLWVCLPHKTDSIYWRSLATLIHQKLDTNLKVYVEYSNEIWNANLGGQYAWCNTQGVANNLPGATEWQKGAAYAMWQSFKIFKEFESVFGEAAMGIKIIRVFASGGNLNLADLAFKNVSKNINWNQDQKVDLFAIAPYIGHRLDGGSATIQSDFRNEVEAVFTGQIALARSIAILNDASLGTYEGGQHITTNANLWSSNPLIYNEYIYMLDKFKSYFTVFTHYTHTGSWSSQGAWGAKASTGQSIDSAHKYRALVNWNNINNRCINHIDLQGNHGNIQTYRSSSTIVSPLPLYQNSILSGSRIKYNAGNSIFLNPGFSATNGSVFEIQIEGCP